MITVNAQDWAQLDRYKNTNSTLNLDTVDMVFMGDSITEGWPQFRPSFLPTDLFAGVLAGKRHRKCFCVFGKM